MPASKATREQLEYDLDVLKLTPLQVAEKYGYKPRSIWRAIKYREMKQPHIGVGYKTLTSEQHQLITGTLMGDATLRRDNGKHCSLKISHCIAQEELIMWKYQMLQDWITPRGIQTFYKRDGHHPQLVFVTYTHEEFDPYKSLFYPEGKKVISSAVLDKLSELSLAVWFMDDGSHLTKNRGVRIHTSGFSLDENHLISDWFSVRWNIQSHVGKISGGYPVLTLYGDESDKLIELIRPWILPSMLYKINNR